MSRYLTDEEAHHLHRSFSAWLLLPAFLDHLAAGNRSPATIREYRKTIERFFLDIRDCSLDITVDQLRAWLADLRRRNVKPRSISTRVTCLHGFFGFAVDEGRLAVNPIDRLPKIKTPKRLPGALTLGELRAFLAVIDAQPGERGVRDRLLYRLMYTCGLRVSEACTIRIENLDLDLKTVRIVGKGDKERLLALRDEILPALRAWIAEQRAGAARGWLFPGMNPGTHLSPRTVEHHCREYSRQAGLSKSVHPHTLRHTCATHYLLGGAPITFVQAQLGHSSLATTGIYTQLVDSDRERIAAETPLAI